ncbi:hypothetical protein ACSFA0_05670 [Variovorax sp. LT1P1]|uniref:hypothetical protein n=1 Tax=Variovorax sp. LT1P1 TaxID=3443730 RepID=UPI003F48E46A
MNNLVIAKYFDWGTGSAEKLPEDVAQLAQRLGPKWRIERAMDPGRDMTNMAQRANLWHFASQVIAYGVPGDFAEFGSFDGKCGVIFQKVIDATDTTRHLHLYDHFQFEFNLTGRDIQSELKRNFASAEASPPVIHVGDFEDTVPDELPETLAFVHIDCGFGGDPEAHAEVIERLLVHVYPRMSPGAVCMLMDYHEAGRSEGPDHNPGVAIAARRFFADKPEKVSLLWAGEYSHGYFRKRQAGGVASGG